MFRLPFLTSWPSTHLPSDGAAAKKPESGSNDKYRLPPSETVSTKCASLEAFKHEPLDLRPDSIRLLDVLAEPGTGDTVYKLRHTTIHEEQYYALSYEWGKDGDEHEIVINGQLLKIRQNLYSFLNTASPKYRGKSFWIDAICIDQETVKERNHQVEQMGQVYSNAAKVVIWLGSGWTGMTSALAARINEGGNYWDPEGPFHVDTLMFSRALAQHSYFTRLWIVQEILLAKDIDLVNGEIVISWPSFWHCWLRIKDNAQNKSDVCRAVTTVQDSQAYKLWSRSLAQASQDFNHQASIAHRESNMHELLKTYGNSVCSDTRDRVYGLLSLIPNGDRFTVDYEEAPHHLVLRAFKEFADKNKYWNDHWNDSFLGALVTSVVLGSPAAAFQDYLFRCFQGVDLTFRQHSSLFTLHFERLDKGSSALESQGPSCGLCAKGTHVSTPCEFSVGTDTTTGHDYKIKIKFALCRSPWLIRVEAELAILSATVRTILVTLVRYGCILELYIGANLEESAKAYFNHREGNGQSPQGLAEWQKSEHAKTAFWRPQRSTSEWLRVTDLSETSYQMRVRAEPADGTGAIPSPTPLDAATAVRHENEHHPRPGKKPLISSSIRAILAKPTGLVPPSSPRQLLSTNFLSLHPWLSWQPPSLEFPVNLELKRLLEDLARTRE